MTRKTVGQSLIAGLAVCCITAACALNTASSKFSTGDRLTLQGFPKRVAVGTIVGSPPEGTDATARLSRGLVDLGFDVVMSGGYLDRIVRSWGYAVSEAIPADARKKLHETYKLDGLFVGSLSPDKGMMLVDTQMSLRLVSLPSGTLVWSTNVGSDEFVPFWSGTRNSAIMLTEKALKALEKDLHQEPTKAGQQPAPSIVKSGPSKGSN